jgi:hypothetical protein
VPQHPNIFSYDRKEDEAWCSIYTKDNIIDKSFVISFIIFQLRSIPIARRLLQELESPSVFTAKEDGASARMLHRDIKKVEKNFERGKKKK